MTPVTPELMEIIKNFTQITNSGIVFPQGDTISVQDGGGIGIDRSSGRTLVAVAKLSTSIEDPFAVDDCLQLYSALTMFDKPQIQVEPNSSKIIVTNDGENAGTFKLNIASPEVVKAPGDIKFPETDQNTTFRLTSAMYQRIFKGIGVVQSPEVIMYGQDGQLFIAAYDQTNKEANTYVVAVGETDATFSVIIKIESLNKLLKSTDYNVTIAPAGIMRAAATNGSVDITYYIAGQYKK